MAGCLSTRRGATTAALGMLITALQAQVAARQHAGTPEPAGDGSGEGEVMCAPAHLAGFGYRQCAATSGSTWTCAARWLPLWRGRGDYPRHVSVSSRTLSHGRAMSNVDQQDGSGAGDEGIYGPTIRVEARYRSRPRSTSPGSGAGASLLIRLQHGRCDAGSEAAQRGLPARYHRPETGQPVPGGRGDAGEIVGVSSWYLHVEVFRIMGWPSWRPTDQPCCRSGNYTG